MGNLDACNACPAWTTYGRALIGVAPRTNWMAGLREYKIRLVINQKNMSTMRPYLSLLACILSTSASAVVIRHDVLDAKYLVASSDARALINLPHEGHGVLIAPQWVLTAAHAVQWHPVTEVMMGDRCLKVAQLIVHPGYTKLPDELIKGDAAPAMAHLALSDDVALIKLADPIMEVQPLALYNRQDEVGKLVKILGMGATGNGKDGQQGPNRTQLRLAYNRIDGADARYLAYTFDGGATGHALEGMAGNGDSGGPILIEDAGQWKVAGLTSYAYSTGSSSNYKPGIYGISSRTVRVSHYLPWIRQTMGADER